MKNKITFLFWIVSVYSQAQIQTISEFDFEEANFETLTTLKKDLQNVRLVGLGESSHIMGKTYQAKIKMVKYLHQKCGFDVIAIESPMYDLSIYYDEYIKNNKANALDFLTTGAISSVWTTNDMYELFAYILETQKTDRPLIYTGFDESLFFKENYRLNDDYNSFISRLNTDTNSNITTDSLFTKALNFTAKNSYYFAKVNPNDTLALYKTFKDVRNTLGKLNNKNGYYYFWERMTDNIESLYRKNYKTAYRDKQMAKNVSYLVNYEFPDKKIILWAATLHLIEDKTKIQFKTDYSKQYMGHFLKEEFNDQYYVIGFVPAKGVTGFKGYLGLAKKRAKSKKGSLEKYISEKYNPNYAFISLRNKMNIEEITENKITMSNLIGLTSYDMDIPSVVDAFFYLKEEHLASFSMVKEYYEKRKKMKKDEKE